MTFLKADIGDDDIGGGGRSCEPPADVLAAVRGCDLLFLDGWDKHRSARLWARHLRVGGTILMHDWVPGEPQWGHPTTAFLRGLGFVPRFERVAVNFHSILRVWVREQDVVDGGET